MLQGNEIIPRGKARLPPKGRLHIRSFHDLLPCPDHIKALGNKGVQRQKPTREIGGIHKAVFGYGYGRRRIHKQRN